MFSIMARLKHTSAILRSKENYEEKETAERMKRWFYDLFGEHVTFCIQKF